MSELHEGDIVYYVLKASDRPVQPAKQWKGQVKRIVSGTCILVESLEDGYEGQSEYILHKQVKSIVSCHGAEVGQAAAY